MNLIISIYKMYHMYIQLHIQIRKIVVNFRWFFQSIVVFFNFAKHTCKNFNKKLKNYFQRLLTVHEGNITNLNKSYYWKIDI